MAESKRSELLYKQNPITLAFKKYRVERLFLREHVQRSIGQTRLSLVMGLLLVISFGVLDLVSYSNAGALSVPVRFIMIPLGFSLCFVATFFFRRYFEIIALVAIFVAHSGHLLLIWLGPFPPAYGTSITIIILMFLFGLSRIRFKLAIPAAVIIILTYQILVIAILGYPLLALLESEFYIISFTFIAVSAGYSIERFLRADFVKSRMLSTERHKSERLLLNILPAAVCKELKERGITRPVRYEQASVLFADFVGFTKASVGVSAGTLIATLDQYFSQFDTVVTKYGLEKIKTIGDEYMLVAGIPRSSTTHAIDCVMAALDFLEYGKIYRNEVNDLLKLEMRIGISSGPLVAGVLGKSKFTYDVFGSTVNQASRVESASRTGQVTISRTTYNLVKDFFACEARGVVTVKNGEEVELFAIQGFKPEYSLDPDGTMPNMDFVKRYEELKRA